MINPHISAEKKITYFLIKLQFTFPYASIEDFQATDEVFRAGIFKPVWSPGIDAKVSIPPAYVAWWAGTITLFLLGA